jgi:hypothetical protein
MINDAWAYEISQGWLSLTLIRTSETCMVNLNDVPNITENELLVLYEGKLSDKDIMLAMKIFNDYARNR